VDASTRDGGTHAARRRGGGRTAAIATLAVGALALVAAIAATLSDASVRETGTNGVLVSGEVDTLRPGHRVCQDGERVPARTAVLELTATRAGTPPPALAVELTDAARRAPVAAGTAAWGELTATVRLHPAPARERTVRVCLRLRGSGGAAASASATLFGAPAAGAASATDDGARLGGRVRFDYLRAGAESWWAFAPTVVRRVGLGHAWSGSSVALLAALLTLASIAVASWLLVRTG
jgi:hypothetical protein